MHVYTANLIMEVAAGERGRHKAVFFVIKSQLSIMPSACVCVCVCVCARARARACACLRVLKGGCVC